jgi:hypothetical protein
MNPAQELEDRKRIKEAIAKSGYRYFCKLSTKNNVQRWCISYYYYITNENEKQDTPSIVNDINHRIADTLKAMNLHIKNYTITGSVWNKRTGYSEKIGDIAISI